MRFLARASRWRSWIACGAAVALVLPSVVLLPAAGLGFESEVAHGQLVGVHSDAERDRAGWHSREQLSDLPGGPTHPINHDCPQCRVIKYLSTSVLPQADIALLPLAPGDAAPSDGLHQPPDIARVTLIPPIRAPPHPSL
jgi:hypothetical protein